MAACVKAGVEAAPLIGTHSGDMMMRYEFMSFSTAPPDWFIGKHVAEGIDVGTGGISHPSMGLRALWL